MGSVGLAERVERIGRACGVPVTRVDPLELQSRATVRHASIGGKAESEISRTGGWVET